jgi:translation initiation factor 3 subunit B
MLTSLVYLFFFRTRWFYRVQDFARVGWTEQHSRWSPKGTYMATVHERGIKIWGRVQVDDGPVQWESVMRFEHPNVTQLAFSPCENYLVTFNATDPERDDKRNPRALVVWEVMTGKRKRGFLGPPRHMLGPEGQIPWPIFYWSHDDRYFARIADLPNASGTHTMGISVFETPSMGMLDKKSFRAPTGNIMNFMWSPKANILAYATPEEGDAPARVSLLEIPSRKELRQKALFSVATIDLFWHPDGYFLCCKVDRLTKSKKGRFTNFELFRVQAKDIPVEVLEYKEKDTVTEFKWEPSGYRFGVIHGHVDQPGRADVSFHDMQGISGELKHMFTVEKKVCNQLHWSPKGRFILLATLGSQAGNLEWYDVNDLEGKGEPDLIGSDEHFLCSEVHWDPSGRFVATAVTYWRNRNDNGYIIWTLYGKELFRASVDMLYQFEWRPRPPSLLTPAEEKDVRRKMKPLRDQYEREDKDLKDSVSSGQAARRKELRDAYKAFLDEAQARVEVEAELRRAVTGYGADDDQDYEKIVETVETIISVKTEIDWSKKLLTSDDERD